MRNQQEQSEHDTIVKARVGQLYPEFRLIFADIPGYSQPNLINGYRPDIYAEKSNGALLTGTQKKIVISETETTSSYNIDHTREQLRAFRKLPGAVLEVIVPKSVLAAAQYVIVNQWGIEINNWMTF